jgi:hypothetical protein
MVLDCYEDCPYFNQSSESMKDLENCLNCYNISLENPVKVEEIKKGEK